MFSWKKKLKPTVNAFSIPNKEYRVYKSTIGETLSDLKVIDREVRFKDTKLLYALLTKPRQLVRLHLFFTYEGKELNNPIDKANELVAMIDSLNKIAKDNKSRAKCTKLALYLEPFTELRNDLMDEHN